MNRLAFTIAAFAFAGGLGCTETESDGLFETTDVSAREVAALDSSCHNVQGRYFFEPVECPSSSCYSGGIVGAGMLSGEVYLTILGGNPSVGFPDGPGTASSYFGESVVTTRHGSVEFRHVGIFVADPLAPPWFKQSDVSVVTGGDGRFASASGSIWSTGMALPMSGGGVESLSGLVRGDLCLSN